MDLSWTAILEVFWTALVGAVLAGIVCPLLGCFLLVRRTTFYGIALPQFATAGVAFGFAVMPWWIAHVGIGGLDLLRAMEDTHATMNYHLAWAGLFTFGGLAGLLFLGRSGGSEIARVAAAFAVANAATILAMGASPAGEIYLESILMGEIITIGRHELETLAVVLLGTLLSIVVFHRDLLVVSYDRESAVVLGKRVVAFEVLLLVLTGATISVGVMTVGLVLLFGLLVLPPLAARGLARSMLGFYFWAGGIGFLDVVLGIFVSFRLDLPLGPAVVAVSAVSLATAFWVARIARRKRPSQGIEL